jgi:hypothetical protein
MCSINRQGKVSLCFGKSPCLVLVKVQHGFEIPFGYHGLIYVCLTYSFLPPITPFVTPNLPHKKKERSFPGHGTPYPTSQEWHRHLMPSKVLKGTYLTSLVHFHPSTFPLMRILSIL